MTLDADARAPRLRGRSRSSFGIDVARRGRGGDPLADANIVRAIQLVSTERGRDPRDYALVPFGGAGPLHGRARSPRNSASATSSCRPIPA